MSVSYTHLVQIFIRSGSGFDNLPAVLRSAQHVIGWSQRISVFRRCCGINIISWHSFSNSSIFCYPSAAVCACFSIHCCSPLYLSIKQAVTHESFIPWYRLLFLHWLHAADHLSDLATEQIHSFTPSAPAIHYSCLLYTSCIVSPPALPFCFQQYS